MAKSIHKAIFRLDFPLAYKILDKLGEYLGLMMEQLKRPPFSSANGNVDLLQHSLTCSGKIEEDQFNLNLDLKTFNGVAEFPKGRDISELARFPLFEFANELIEKLDQDQSSKYERIGFRTYIIINEKTLRFDRLRDYIWDMNSVFGNAIIPIYEEKRDIGIVFESRTGNEEYLRLSLGPYQKAERPKFFSISGDVNEGFIMDIDIWQHKVSIPKLKLTEVIKAHQKKYTELTTNIISTLEEALK